METVRGAERRLFPISICAAVLVVHVAVFVVVVAVVVVIITVIIILLPSS